MALGIGANSLAMSDPVQVRDANSLSLKEEEPIHHGFGIGRRHSARLAGSRADRLRRGPGTKRMFRRDRPISPETGIRSPVICPYSAIPTSPWMQDHGKNSWHSVELRIVRIVRVSRFSTLRHWKCLCTPRHPCPRSYKPDAIFGLAERAGLFANYPQNNRFPPTVRPGTRAAILRAIPSTIHLACEPLF